MIGYIIIPNGLTDEQEHIYIKLYKKCDFKTMQVKYTLEQLVNDSNPAFKLTKRRITPILKFLIKERYITELEKGVKGKPTLYKITKITELNEIKKHLENNEKIGIEFESNLNRICIEPVSNDVVIVPPVEDLGNECVSKRNRIGIEFVPPIKDTKKKENIYAFFASYPKRENEEYSLKLIEKAINKVGIEQLEKSLENYISKINRENIKEQYVKSSVTFFGGGYEQYLNSNIKTDWEKFMEKENERRFY